MKNQEEFFPNVVTWENNKYFKCKNTFNSYVSMSGSVLVMDVKGILHNAPQWESKTTKGSYLTVSVLNEDLRFTPRSIHILVCEAFHHKPNKSGKRLEPNHKDGNKHNNAASNLEWVTRSENIQHAFDAGLCQVGVRVKAISKVTGIVKYYNSLSSMSREWGIGRKSLTSILANHKTRPYEEEWVFEVDNASDKKLKRHQSVPVMCMNYLTNTITVYRDANEAEQQTGVKASTITYRINSKVNLSKYSPLAEYVFKDTLDQTPFPNHSKEYIEYSKNLYNSIDANNKSTLDAVEIYDLTTDTTKIFRSKREFAESIGKYHGYVTDMIDENIVYFDRYKIKFLMSNKLQR